jgi:hypothetical protein
MVPVKVPVSSGRVGQRAGQVAVAKGLDANSLQGVGEGIEADVCNPVGKVDDDGPERSVSGREVRDPGRIIHSEVLVSVCFVA